MKKWIAALLTLILAVSLCVPALGETSYEVLKGLMETRNEGVEELYLGTPVTITSESPNTDKLTMLWYDGDSKLVFLTGTNTNGRDVISVWSEVDLASGIYLIYSLCGVWDTLAGLADYGYTVVLGLASGDDTAWITNATEAAAFRTTLESMLK
ncbi:MAG: hypothetical protein CW338_06980 [Clostridiales bacterium]|nr:hypothetical protein [Clostridiales bacterium]